MKNTLFLLICFLASLPASPAFSQPSARIAGGPYLQNVTEDGFTVIWTTTTDAAAWVETAPDDGTHFYAVERPKYYDSHLGRRRLGKLHRVRVGGLEPGKTYRYRIWNSTLPCVFERRFVAVRPEALDTKATNGSYWARATAATYSNTRPIPSQRPARTGTSWNSGW